MCSRHCHRRVDIYYSTNYNKCKFTLAPYKLPVFAVCYLLESACYFVVIVERSVRGGYVRNNADLISLRVFTNIQWKLI